MDQKQLAKQLEAHFRAEDEKLHDQTRKSRREQDLVSDEEWWHRIVTDTKSIRPQMLSIFERNKEEMISKRFQKNQSEEGFREKRIQQKVMELLPHVSAVRFEICEIGSLTQEQIQLAISRLESHSRVNESNPFNAETKDRSENEDSNIEVDFIQNLIDIQIRRQEELN